MYCKETKLGILSTGTVFNLSGHASGLVTESTSAKFKKTYQTAKGLIGCAPMLGGQFQYEGELLLWFPKDTPVVINSEEKDEDDES